MITPDRYCRQRKLSEIGDAGQSRISSAVLEVRGADGAIIEAEYLHRAGVERLTLLPRAEPEPFLHETHFRFFASRRVAAGAWRALRKLRRELGLESG
jgi:hypothetical protein